MRLAFGKPVGHAVRANIGDVLFTLSFRSENQNEAKEALRKAACKLPMPTSVLMEEDKNVVEGPRAAPIVVAPAPEKPAEEAAEGEAAAPAEGEEKPAAPVRGGGALSRNAPAPAKGAPAPAKGAPAPAKPAKPAK
jgi:hypothetical protein